MVLSDTKDDTFKPLRNVIKLSLNTNWVSRVLNTSRANLCGSPLLNEKLKPMTVSKVPGRGSITIEKEEGSCNTDTTFGTGKRGRLTLLIVTNSEAKRGEDLNIARTDMFELDARGNAALMISNTKTNMKLKSFPRAKGGRISRRKFLK